MYTKAFGILGLSTRDPDRPVTYEQVMGFR